MSTNELQPWLRTHDAWRNDMNTKDKPVCWQCRVMFPDGTWSDWFDHESEDSRDRHAEDFNRFGHEYETRDLYARPQPARDETPVALGNGIGLPAWVLHYANELGAYMKCRHGEPWTIGPVQSRGPQPAASGEAARLIEGLTKIQNIRSAIGGTDEIAKMHADACLAFLHKNHDALVAALSQPSAPQVPSLEWLHAEHERWLAKDDAGGFIEHLHAAMLAAPPAPEQPKPAGDVEALRQDWFRALWLVVHGQCGGKVSVDERDIALTDWSRASIEFLTSPASGSLLILSAYDDLAAQPEQGEGEK